MSFDLPPAALVCRFLRWSGRLNAEPVWRASIKLSITPSWVSWAFMSTKARFRSARAALSASAFSRAIRALLCFSSVSRSFTISFWASYSKNTCKKTPCYDKSSPFYFLILKNVLFEETKKWRIVSVYGESLYKNMQRSFKNFIKISDL